MIKEENIMKKLCLLLFAVVFVGVFAISFSSCAPRASVTQNLEKSLKQKEIQYSDINLDDRQLIIKIESDSIDRCSEKDVKDMMRIFHTLARDDFKDKFDYVQVTITDKNGKMIYNNNQHISFSDVKRMPHSTEKADDICRRIENQIEKNGIESKCLYSIETVDGITRIDFTVTYDGSAYSAPIFDINGIYDSVTADSSENCDIGYCTMKIMERNSTENDIYFEGDCDLNILFAWISPKMAAGFGPPSEEDF